MRLRRPTGPIRLVIAAGLLAAAAGGVSATGASFTDGFADDLQLKTGTVGLVRDGDALVLDGSHLLPGDTVIGTVRLTDSGSLPERVTLTHEALESTAPNGCSLRDALRARVLHATGDAAPHEDYAGSLAGMDPTALGRLAPGETATYRIKVTFPAAGDATATSADNCRQGSLLRERFAWAAEEAAR